MNAAREPNRMVEWYRQMLLIRGFEEKVQELFSEGLVPGSTHLCEGQEAVSVGAVAAMADGDFLTGTYRGHGQALARGVSVQDAFAELMGRQTGLCKGLGGSMHLADRALGLLGTFAIVGAGLPVAVGAALSAKLQGSRAVALTFFGDGATNIGTFHEALNMAAVWAAPVVFVCENNLYGEYTPLRETTAVSDLAIRAAAYGMPGEIVDGMDVVAVHERSAVAIARARNGEGPTLLEMKTYRYRGHSRSDLGKYRPPDELAEWKSKDPITHLGRTLIEQGILDAPGLAAVAAEVQAMLDEASGLARQDPPPTLEDLYDSVYAG